MAEHQCPTCGGAVEVRGSDEGTNYYIPVGHAEYVEAQAENARPQAQADTATTTGLRVMKERDALQARVEEAEAERDVAQETVVALSTMAQERDRYKALAERRKKALEKIEEKSIGFSAISAAGEINVIARAAIESAKS